MKTDFANQFDKDLNKIRNAAILEKVEQSIINVEEAIAPCNISGA